MSENSLPIKDSEIILCKYCIRIKNRSKRFSSLHALRWHVTHHHKDEVRVLETKSSKTSSKHECPWCHRYHNECSDPAYFVICKECLES